MENITHIIDPDGDVVYTFKDPNAPFAVWDHNAMNYGRSEPGHVQSEHTDAADAQHVAGDVGVRNPSIAPKSGPQKKVGLSEVRMLVSSKHLVLASPYFKAMFTGPWKESAAGATTEAPLALKGPHCVEKAMLVVMSIIHGKTRQVPRKLPLKLLADVASVVHRYQCHQAVEIFSDLWLGACNDELPTGYEAVLRLFVSWVFSDENDFRSMSRLFERRSRGPLRTLNLPIPQVIVGKWIKPGLDFVYGWLTLETDRIEQKRQASVSRILDKIYESLTDLSESNSSCSNNCYAMRLGALMRHLVQQDLYPRPETPYLGINFEQLECFFDTFSEPLWHEYSLSSLRLIDARGEGFEDGWKSCHYNATRNPSASGLSRLECARRAYQAEVLSGRELEPHGCSVVDPILPTIIEVEKSLEGLNLSVIHAESGREGVRYYQPVLLSNRNKDLERTSTVDADEYLKEY
ncbi:hypothetical protein TOPH_03480 [Tolypocladium ophioglossoides CBS 100239]|uniref:BTB domain-containing protein n=1 Tax=Tolypocladium ophioglossoides (strain CBS 100239) TaxID=1163406 RepID=A0A0L0NDH2_TOLOC|nr:hypothetical protein TOPH_03480 [Tolypocladium ophioglossoides CBS 100239]